MEGPGHAERVSALEEQTDRRAENVGAQRAPGATVVGESFQLCGAGLLTAGGVGPKRWSLTYAPSQRRDKNCTVVI